MLPELSARPAASEKITYRTNESTSMLSSAAFSNAASSSCVKTPKNPASARKPSFMSGAWNSSYPQPLHLASSMMGRSFSIFSTAERYTLSVIAARGPAFASSSATSMGSSIRYTPAYSPETNSSTYRDLLAPKLCVCGESSAYMSQLSRSRMSVSSSAIGRSRIASVSINPGTLRETFFVPSASRVNSTRYPGLSVQTRPLSPRRCTREGPLSAPLPGVLMANAAGTSCVPISCCASMEMIGKPVKTTLK